MRILLITPRLPWPPVDGGRVAMSTLATSLASAGADIRVLSLNPQKHRGTAISPLPLEAFDIDTSRVLAPAARSLSRRLPCVVARFVSPAFERRAVDVLRAFKPDVVQVESPFMLPYVGAVRSSSPAAIALRSLNVEFRIWETLADSEPSVPKRFAYRKVAASLRKYEVRAMRELDAIVPISIADANDFRELGVDVPMHVAPCGMRTFASTHTAEPFTVAFLGSLDYRPNQEAVRWIVRQLWPRVVAQVPEARLTIAGSSPPPWMAGLTGDSVRFAGRVEDSAAFLQQHAVVIAPLFAGGGMRIKVLEAMALGRPLVATALGAGGVDVRDGHDALLAEDAGSFATAVVQLLRDPALATRIGASARATVSREYDPDAIARGLLGFYESLIERSLRGT